MCAKLYVELASAVGARLNCLASKNTEWEEKHESRINALVSAHMPSGSGFDNGTAIDLDKSTGEKLVFSTAFHHMDEAGGYCGWTEHEVTAVPSFLGGFSLKISGRDRNDIKDYIGDTFQHALSTDVA